MRTSSPPYSTTSGLITIHMLNLDSKSPRGHYSATNHILAAAALGEVPPADAADEMGLETLRSKAEILTYLKGSFVHLDKAVEGQTNIPVHASPISAPQTRRSDSLSARSRDAAACL